MNHSIGVLQFDAKGGDSRVGADWLVSKLELSGYEGAKITLRTDKEPSFIALKKAVAVKRKSETAFIESPVRESKSNG